MQCHLYLEHPDTISFTERLNTLDMTSSVTRDEVLLQPILPFFFGTNYFSVTLCEKYYASCKTVHTSEYTVSISLQDFYDDLTPFLLILGRHNTLPLQAEERCWSSLYTHEGPTQQSVGSSFLCSIWLNAGCIPDPPSFPSPPQGLSAPLTPSLLRKPQPQVSSFPQYFLSL